MRTLIHVFLVTTFGNLASAAKLKRKRDRHFLTEAPHFEQAPQLRNAKTGSKNTRSRRVVRKHQRHV